VGDENNNFWHMRKVAIYLPDFLIETIDGLVEKGEFMNRSECVRFAVRFFVMQYTKFRNSAVKFRKKKGDE